jgi:hypothetical protein
MYNSYFIKHERPKLSNHVSQIEKSEKKGFTAQEIAKSGAELCLQENPYSAMKRPKVALISDLKR